MKREDFEKIKAAVNNYIIKLSKLADTCTIDGVFILDHLTVKELTILVDQARELQGKTDQFLKQDLYHIIGMGNLSGSQTTTLTKLVKQLTEHRSVMKTVAAISPIALPKKVTATTSYNSKVLNYTLSR